MIHPFSNRTKLDGLRFFIETTIWYIVSLVEKLINSSYEEDEKKTTTQNKKFQAKDSKQTHFWMKKVKLCTPTAMKNFSSPIIQMNNISFILILARGRSCSLFSWLLEHFIKKNQTQRQKLQWCALITVVTKYNFNLFDLAFTI